MIKKSIQNAFRIDENDYNETFVPFSPIIILSKNTK